MFARSRALLSLAVLAATVAAVPAAADQPTPWQTGFQEAASPVMVEIEWLYDYLTAIIVAIVVLVTGLLAYVIVRFNARRNPEPSKTTHNTTLEVVWTVIPILILITIAVPSFRLLYYMDRAQDAEMTLKVIGHQWYWSYEYPDHGGFTFDSVMVDEEDLAEGQPRLLAVDEEVVLPVDTTIRIIVSADDVIHSWAVPALGLKTDAVPGRLNETWVRIEREGVYYGQCTELCGINHGFMPVAVRAVSKQDFAAWVERAREEFAAADGTPVVVTEVTQ